MGSGGLLLPSWQNKVPMLLANAALIVPVTAWLQGYCTDKTSWAARLPLGQSFANSG